MDESSDMEQDRENDKQSINNGDTESAFECRRIRCSKTFDDEESLSVHEKKCRGGKLVKEPKVYMCPKSFCKNKKKDFKTSFNLNRHIKVCIEKGKKSFVCQKCQKEFAKKYKLDRHIPTHEKKESLVCRTCWKGFSRTDFHQAHVLQCTASATASSTGILCDSRTPSMANQFDTPGIGNAANESISPSCSPIDDDVSFNAIDEVNPLLSSTISMLPSASVDSSCNTFTKISKESMLLKDTSVNVNPDQPEVFILDDMFQENQESPLENCDIDDFDFEVSACTLKYLKNLKYQIRKSSVKLQEYAKLCIALFSHKFDDNHFMSMLANDLGFLSKDEFLEFINLDRIAVIKRGPPVSNLNYRQLAYNFWKENSELRNGRHEIKIKPEKLANQVLDLQRDPNISESKAKGGGKRLKAQKYIFSMTLNQMYEKFSLENPGITSSRSTFYRCKPFYISPATPREMEGCLCQNCLNPHVLYQTIRQSIPHLPLSLSEYLGSYFVCQKDVDVNFLIRTVYWVLAKMDVQ